MLQERNDGGRRLAGYAFLMVRPQVALLADLLESVTAIEGTPFGQYWGLQAIVRVLSQPWPSEPAVTLGQVRRRLEQFLTKLPKGSDRWYEAKRILEQLGTNGDDHA